MSTENNKKIVRRFYMEIVNTGNIDGIEEFISDDYTEDYNGERHVVGIEGARAHILGVRQTYANLHITIDQQIAEGEWVVSCITTRAIHTGSWMGMAPTGKPVVFTGVNIDRVVDNRIVEHGGAANMLEPLLEIGAVKIVRYGE